MRILSFELITLYIPPRFTSYLTMSSTAWLIGLGIFIALFLEAIWEDFPYCFESFRLIVVVRYFLRTREWQKRLSFKCPSTLHVIRRCLQKTCHLFSVLLDCRVVVFNRWVCDLLCHNACLLFHKFETRIPTICAAISPLATWALPAADERALRRTDSGLLSTELTHRLHKVPFSILATFRLRD